MAVFSRDARRPVVGMEKEVSPNFFLGMSLSVGGVLGPVINGEGIFIAGGISPRDLSLLLLNDH